MSNTKSDLKLSFNTKDKKNVCGSSLVSAHAMVSNDDTDNYDDDDD